MKKIIALLVFSFGVFAQQPVLSVYDTKIADGRAFSFTYQASASLGTNVDVVFLTPNKMIYSHIFIDVVSAVNGVAVYNSSYMFDTIVYTNTSNQTLFFNDNRSSARAATLKAYVSPGVTNITTNASAVTNAVQPWTFISGKDTFTHKFILQTNRSYLFRVVPATNAEVVTVTASYYEN